MPIAPRPLSTSTDTPFSFMSPDWAWTGKFRPFKELGDVFLVVSPGYTSMNVADPDVITQITNRRNDFPKPLEMYGSIDLFGKNVVTTEGSIWRHHRKITSPPFSEKNNQLVWNESLHQAKSMLTHWVGPDGDKVASFSDVAAATMQLSLHIISRAGFGERLKWAHEEQDDGGADALAPGHTLTYKNALSGLLEDILQVMLLPSWFLSKSRSPFCHCRRPFHDSTDERHRELANESQQTCLGSLH